jgi:hypothetical protein
MKPLLKDEAGLLEEAEAVVSGGIQFTFKKCETKEVSIPSLRKSVKVVVYPVDLGCS